MKRKLFATILVLLTFIGLFSCTTVHDDRLKIYYVKTNEDMGVPVPSAGVIELNISSGTSINLDHLKFPRIQYDGDYIFGYKNKNENYYLDYIMIGDKKAYLFQVDRTDVLWNTSQPLPSSNISIGIVTFNGCF